VDQRRCGFMLVALCSGVTFGNNVTACVGGEQARVGTEERCAMFVFAWRRRGINAGMFVLCHMLAAFTGASLLRGGASCYSRATAA